MAATIALYVSSMGGSSEGNVAGRPDAPDPPRIDRP
jgi:hypothetical protein